MKKPKYYLSPTSSSICPKCNNKVHILATHDVSDAPAFFVCHCGFVGQIGMGQVPVFQEEQPAPEEELTSEQKKFYIEAARGKYALGSSDDIEIDDPTEFSVTDNGVWVKGWMWIAHPVCDTCDEPYEQSKGEDGFCPACVAEAKKVEEGE